VIWEPINAAANVVYTSTELMISHWRYAFIMQAEVVLVSILNLTTVLHHSGIDFYVYHLTGPCYY
jgi:hypothetical protein